MYLNRGVAIMTKYSIVKQAIKSKILDGSYHPNQKISSESELMKQFGVSRHTVRLAIGDLVTEGWLYKKQGSGTFCADKKAFTSQTNGMSTRNIAIITTYISDYIFPSIIRGAETYLSENGYQVSLFSTNNNFEMERNILEKILSQNFDGVIIEPTKSALSNPNINYYINLESQKIPYIMINADYDALEPLSITLNDEQGGFLQAEHLIKLGHENILGFFKTDDIQGVKRMKGYLKAHRKYNKVIDPNNLITYRSDEKETKPKEELSKLLLQKNERFPTAIVCYNDELAVMLLDVLREKNLKVPEDISIVGFDDSFLAKVSEVKLTTVEHPKSELGKNAAETILSLIRETNEDTMDNKLASKVFEPELIVRGSTKKI